MRLNTETQQLIIYQVDVDHIIGWFVDGISLQEAIEVELHLHGLEGEWEFDANKIVFEE